MTLDEPAAKPPSTAPMTTGMTNTSAVVDTLICDRSGSINAPSATAQTMPMPEPESRLFTGTFFYENDFVDGDEQNEEIMKGADAI
jgi:hypothetical protein